MQSQLATSSTLVPCFDWLFYLALFPKFPVSAVTFDWTKKRKSFKLSCSPWQIYFCISQFQKKKIFYTKKALKSRNSQGIKTYIRVITICCMFQTQTEWQTETLTTTVLVAQIWKSPHISQSDNSACHRQNKLCFAPPLPTLLRRSGLAAPWLCHAAAAREELWRGDWNRFVSLWVLGWDVV